MPDPLDRTQPIKDISSSAGDPETRGATSRRASLSRQTGETQVEVRLDLDGSGRHQIDTGLPFLDHMLVQIAVRGLFDLSILAKGDLHIDHRPSRRGDLRLEQEDRSR